jgi:hypothetical protein
MPVEELDDLPHLPPRVDTGGLPHHPAGLQASS